MSEQATQMFREAAQAPDGVRAQLESNQPRMEQLRDVLHELAPRAIVTVARDGGACTVALVNAENSPLARSADFSIPLCAGPETSVAATKSYIASLAAIVHFVAVWSADHELLNALERTTV